MNFIISISFNFSAENEILEFNKESIYLSKLYNQFFISKNKCNKIDIQLVNSKVEEKEIPYHRITKVYSLYTYFELDNYRNLNQEERFRFLLNYVNNILQYKISIILKLKKDIFEKAFKNIKNKGLVNDYPLINKKKSQKRKCSIEVKAIQNKDYSKLLLILYDLNDIKTKEIEFLRVIYFENNLSSIANKISWIDNENLVVSNILGEINFKINIVDNIADVFFIPKKHNKDYLVDELTLLNFSTKKSDYLKICDKRTREFG